MSYPFQNQSLLRPFIDQSTAVKCLITQRSREKKKKSPNRKQKRIPNPKFWNCEDRFWSCYWILTNYFLVFFVYSWWWLKILTSWLLRRIPALKCNQLQRSSKNPGIWDSQDRFLSYWILEDSAGIVFQRMFHCTPWLLKWRFGGLDVDHPHQDRLDV